MHPGVVGKTEHFHRSENMIHCVLSKMVCSKSDPGRLGMAVPGKQAKADTRHAGPCGYAQVPDCGALDPRDNRAFDYFSRQTLRADRSPAFASARATAVA